MNIPVLAVKSIFGNLSFTCAFLGPGSCRGLPLHTLAAVRQHQLKARCLQAESAADKMLSSTANNISVIFGAHRVLFGALIDVRTLSHRIVSFTWRPRLKIEQGSYPNPNPKVMRSSTSLTRRGALSRVFLLAGGYLTLAMKCLPFVTIWYARHS